MVYDRFAPSKWLNFLSFTETNKVLEIIYFLTTLEFESLSTCSTH